jgi:hypothetical protein
VRWRATRRSRSRELEEEQLAWMTADGSSCGIAAAAAGEAAPPLLPSTHDGERIRRRRHSAPRTTLTQGRGEPGREARGRASREISGVRHLLEHGERHRRCG